MKLVEAEAVGPVEGDDALVTPPPPPHRRVSVSLVLTLSVLVGTVVTIYLAFPPRHNVLVTEAIAQHRDAAPAWDVVAPTARDLRTFALGVFGSDAPLPAPASRIVGARRLDVLDRGALLVRLKIGDDDVTYLVQHARGIAPDHSERRDGELRAVSWRRGPFACVAVGADASAAVWLRAFTAAGS